MSEPAHPTTYTKEHIHYTFRVVEENAAFKATEPNTQTPTYGRGDTPAEAIIHYCELMTE